MRTIAGHLAASTEQSFDQETAPDGTPWAKLSPVTIARREKSGHTPIKTLRASADLKRSIVQDWDSNSAEVGTITQYATTHQFGAKKGQFGKTKGGAPIPWGDIPARPFLGVAAQQHQIQQAIIDFITDQWR